MILFKKIYILIIYSLLITTSTVVHADQFTYRIKPVSLSYTSEGALEATFGLACNGTFTGMAYFLGSDKRTLRIGAVERIGAKLCAGFERTRTVPLDEIDTTSSTPQGITAGQAGQRVLYYRIEQIRNTPTSANRSLLQISFTAACYPGSIGILLAKRRPWAGEAAIISLYASKPKDGTDAKKGDCPIQTGLVKLKLATHGQILAIDPLNPTPSRLEGAYRVKSTSIFPSSIKISPIYGVTFRYTRRCNEAPIGMAITPKKNGSIGISMIVAAYYNDPCIKSYKNNILSSYAVNNIKLTPGQISAELVPAAPQKILRIVPPQRFSIRAQGGIDFKLFDDCQTSQSVIIGDSGPSEIFMGVLQGAATTECKNKLKEVSWYLPDVKMRPSGKVRPLAMWGTL